MNKKKCNPRNKAFKRYRDNFFGVEMTNDFRKSNMYENKMMVGMTEDNFSLILFRILLLEVKNYPL